MTAAAVVVGGLLARGGLLLALFTLGFSTKFAPLHAAIRRFNRDVTNPRQLQHGETTQIARPTLVPADQANHLFPRNQQQMHRIHGVKDFLVVSGCGYEAPRRR